MLRAARSGDPIRAVVVELSRQVLGEVALVDTSGEAISTAAKGNFAISHPWLALARERIRPHGLGGVTAETFADLSFQVRKIRSFGTTTRLLIVATSYDSSDTQDAIETAGLCLEIALNADEVAMVARRSNRESLLEIALADAVSESHIDWLIAHGIAAQSILRVVVISPSGASSRLDGRELYERVCYYFESQEVAFLSASKDQSSVILFAAEAAEASTLFAASLEGISQRFAGQGLQMGYSNAYEGIGRIPEMFNEAVLAHDLADQDAASQSYASLGHLYRLVNAMPESTIASLSSDYSKLYSSAKGSHILHDALTHFLNCNGSVAEASRSLFLHENSLRKRLKAVEAKLNLNLKSVAGLCQAQLLHIAREIWSVRSKYATIPASAPPDTPQKAQGDTSE